MILYANTDSRANSGVILASVASDLSYPSMLHSPTQPLLYTYRRCPYAMRARMALLVAGVQFEAVEIVLRDKPAELLRISPKGTVPVLQCPGGQVLEQSWAIMQWALAPQDPQGWWSRAQTPENLALLHLNDGEFKHHLDRYKYPDRFGGADASAHWAQAQVALLQPLQQRLERAPYLGGDAPCATDLALFPFVRQLAAVDPCAFAALPLPAVQAWLAGWLSSPLFEACMVKLPAQCPQPFPVYAV